MDSTTDRRTGIAVEVKPNAKAAPAQSLGLASHLVTCMAPGQSIRERL